MDQRKATAGVDGTNRTSQLPRAVRTNNTGQRRPKIAQACEECRARKVRCDGGLPVCGACRRRRKPRTKCIYLAEKSARVTAEYVAALEKRVRHLEALGLDTMQDNLVSDHLEHIPKDIRPNDPSSDFDKLTHTIPGEGLRQITPVRPTQDNSTHIDRNDISSVSRHDEGVDGMGVIEAPEPSCVEESSSAASFMNQVKKAIASRLSSSFHQPPAKSLHTEIPDSWNDLKGNYSHRSIAELFVLPSRAIADEMLDVYWTEVHVLYPFLIPHRFKHLYRSLWTRGGSESTNNFTFCILNLIFAIVCQVRKRESPAEKAVSAEVFCRRATHLLQVNLIGRGSLELIQALLLLGQYVQSTESPHRCWVVIGMAIRISQGLGLHIPRTTENISQQEERELARRLWHGCVFMDRVVSMTLGLPMVVSKRDALAVPLPACLDDADLSTTPGQDTAEARGVVTQAEFYVQSLRLYEITEEVLSAMYASEGRVPSMTKENLSPVERVEQIDFSTVLMLDASLRQWYASLPNKLKVRKNNAEDVKEAVLLRQANLLRLRYLQIRILLFRPVFSLLLAADVRAKALSPATTENWLPFSVALPCARVCLLSALEVICLTYEHQNWDNAPIVEPLPSWWWEVFFIFTAATALIPAKVYAYIRGDTPVAALAEGWERSLQILRRLSCLSSAAVACLAALQMLNDELVFEESQDQSHRHDISLTAANTEEVEQNEIGLPSLGANVDDITEQNRHDERQPSVFNVADPLLPMQDFGWLEYLPADLLTGEFTDLS